MDRNSSLSICRKGWYPVSGMLLARRADCRAEEPRKNASKEDTEHGHTGTYYAHVDFNDGPVRDVPLVPGWICRVGEVHQRMQSENRYHSHTVVRH